MRADTSKRTDMATLVGGCFWCRETVFYRAKEHHQNYFWSR